MTRVSGIDVSRYQGEIDWALAAADGVEFAMIKALQGLKEDKRFRGNAEGAGAAGVPFGVYVYSKAASVQDAADEARAVLELTAGYDLAYPVALDFESPHFLTMSMDERGGIIDAFCGAVKAAGGTPMLYSNKNWLTNHIPAECAAKWDVWLAQWRKTDPDYAGSFSMWQYGKGRVNGIAGSVDMDICFRDYPAEHELARTVHFAVTTPRLTGEAVLKMQLALIAANYTDYSGTPLEPDGIWGARSQSALGKLVAAQTK